MGNVMGADVAGKFSPQNYTDYATKNYGYNSPVTTQYSKGNGTTINPTLDPSYIKRSSGGSSSGVDTSAYLAQLESLISEYEDAQNKALELSRQNSLASLEDTMKKYKDETLGAYRKTLKENKRYGGVMKGATLSANTVAGNTYNNNLTELARIKNQYQNQIDSNYYSNKASTLTDTLNNKMNLYKNYMSLQ